MNSSLGDGQGLPELTLQANDGTYVNIGLVAAQRSIFLRNMLADLNEMDNGPQGIGITIPISGVTGLILQKIAAWCEHHKNDPHTDDDEDDEGSRKRTDDIVEWDQVFMQVDHETLFDIIWAADFLDIRPLIDLGCKTIANMVKGKSPQEIRQIFNISTESNTDEEEIRRKNGRSYMSTG